MKLYSRGPYGFWEVHTALDGPRLNQSNCEFHSCYTIIACFSPFLKLFHMSPACSHSRILLSMFLQWGALSPSTRNKGHFKVLHGVFIFTQYRQHFLVIYNALVYISELLFCLLTQSTLYKLCAFPVGHVLIPDEDVHYRSVFFPYRVRHILISGEDES